MISLEAFNSNYAVAAAILAVAGTVYKIAKEFLEFHDELLKKRPFKRLSFLAAEAKGHERLEQLISTAKQEQVFRSIIGRVGSPAFITAVAALCSSNQFSIAELRACSTYMTLRDDGSVDIEPGIGGNIVLSISIAFIVLMAIYISALVTLLLREGTGAAVIAAIVLMALFFGFFMLLGGDARSVYVAKRVKHRLAKYRAVQKSAETKN